MSERITPTPEYTAQAAEDVRQIVLKEEAQRQQERARIEAHGINREIRTSSAEVYVLNKQAEIAVFGTGADPAKINDGEANPGGQPVRGKLADILDDREYGETKGEREAAASAYFEDLQDLLGEGLQLCQAKLIMDLREEHNGDHAMFNETPIRRLIKNEGIFSQAELKAYLHDHEASSNATADTEQEHTGNGEDDNDDDQNDAQNEPPIDPVVIERLETEQAQLMQEFLAARDTFARLSAEQSGRILTGHKQQELDDAKVAYDTAEQNLMANEIHLALAEGNITPEEIDRFAVATAAENALSLTTVMYGERLVSSGRATWDRHGNLHMTKDSPLQQFYDWYGRQTGKKGMIKKALATGALGAGIGLLFSFGAGFVFGAGAIGAGAAAGAGVASRVARTFLGARIINKSHERRQADLLDEELHNFLLSDDWNGGDHMSAEVMMQTDREVAAHRKRFAVAVGSGAVGGALGYGLGELFGFDGDTGHVAAHHGGGHPEGGSNHTHPSKPSTSSHASGQHHQGGPTQSHTYRPNHHHRHPSQGAEEAREQKTIDLSNGEYVATVYENADGLHAGFTEMLHAAHAAIHQGLLEKIQPNPNNPNLFWYEVTKKGAKFAKGAVAGSSRTEDVMRVLQHFGNVKLS